MTRPTWYRPAASAHRQERVGGLLLALSLLLHLAPASAQFKLQQTFADTTAPGWTLSGSALLTAPSVDPAGAGWLRLTDTGGNEKGVVLDTAQTFAGNQPVTVRFSYVAWGGTGADGITVFLYDSTQDMSGATTGGGLAYCGGAGGFLAIGLDEYGNFSNPADKCGAASGGPGRTADSLVIRGPMSASDQYVTGVPIPGGVDNPGVSARPSPKTVIVTLTPAAVGYTITAQFQGSAGQAFQTLFSNVAFPYAPPASLSVGFSGSTGGSTNYHELQGLVAATPDDLQMTLSGPATILQGTPVSYTLTVTNNGPNAISGADAPLVTDALPANITAVSWTCSPGAGATCTASGSGDLNTSGLTLPSNASVTYTITGTLDPAAACGSTVTDSASVDFGSTSTFLDPDETNNSPSVSSTVTCAVTLVANPGAINFGPLTVGMPSAAQTITVTGTNGALISNVTTTGDFTQTNDCSGALNAGTSCSIQVIFTPSSEGSLNGALVITSSATSSPTTVMLSGTGTNAVPGQFTFMALNNVDPGTQQSSNPITVTGTNVPTTISVSAGAEYSINGGPFTSTPGVVSPGAQVTVRLTSSNSYGTQVSAVVTIGGVSATFDVTTKPQPQLVDVTVTSGGGGSTSLLLIVALALALAMRRGRAVVAAVMLLAVCGVLGSEPSVADDADTPSRVYFGGAIGAVTTSLTAGKVTGELQSGGYEVVASDLKHNTLSGSLYIGLELPRQFALEFGWTYLGHTTVALSGIEPPNLDQLLDDTAHATRGSGDAWTLVGRYRWALQPNLSIDLRAGPYRWITHSAIWIGSAEQFERNDRGWGYMLGVGPRYALAPRWTVGLNANYFASTADNRFFQFSANVDYYLR